MRRAARTDANHSEVIEALRAAGWYVRDTSSVGGGFPDAIAAKHGRVEFIEIKDGSKSLSRQALTPEEAKFHASLALAGVQVRLIRSIQEAVQL